MLWIKAGRTLAASGPAYGKSCNRTMPTSYGKTVGAGVGLCKMHSQELQRGKTGAWLPEAEEQWLQKSVSSGPFPKPIRQSNLSWIISMPRVRGSCIVTLRILQFIIFTGDLMNCNAVCACKMLHAALDCPTPNQSRIPSKISPPQNLFGSTSKSFQIYQHPSIFGFRNLCTNFGIHQAGCCEHSALAHIASAPGCCWSLALDRFQALV